MKHLLLFLLGIFMVAGCIQSNPADTESTEKLIARTMIHTTAQDLAGLAEQASRQHEVSACSSEI
jgi:PBP1b-binding outer membrane lipoprotein LpoB